MGFAAKVQNLFPRLQEVVVHLELRPRIVDIAQMNHHVRLLVSNLPENQLGGILTGSPVAHNGHLGLGWELAFDHEVAQALVNDVGNLLLLGDEVLGVFGCGFGVTRDRNRQIWRALAYIAARLLGSPESWLWRF